MECTKCKLQYVGKAETELKLRINKRCLPGRKDLQRRVPKVN